MKRIILIALATLLCVCQANAKVVSPDSTKAIDLIDLDMEPTPECDLTLVPEYQAKPIQVNRLADPLARRHYTDSAAFKKRVDAAGGFHFIDPDTTVTFCQRDTSALMMDIYYPYVGSETHLDGIRKPTIMYIFGGGFVSGERDAPLHQRWYRKLAAEGFTVVSIDYRLGMKGLFGPNSNVAKVDLIKHMDSAINIALEDLYEATNYLITNGEGLGVDPRDMVISGSSAGAMMALHADYQLCNRDKFNVPLPADFRYKAVMSFSGAIFSLKGAPKYKSGVPCPTVFFHGMDDKIVLYNKMAFFNISFSGSNFLAKRYAKAGANYRIYRYKDCGHEVAASMLGTFNEQLDFIYSNVMHAQHKIVDAQMYGQ